MTKESGMPVALVTGAARRIGRAIALHLGRNGWRVAIHCRRSSEEAQTLRDEIRRHGGDAAVFVADLAEAERLTPMVNEVSQRLGAIELLVNNASLFEFEKAENTTIESWDAHLNVNLRAPFFLSQAMVHRLPPGGRGNIINIIDQRVWRPTPYFTSYTVSKAGLLTLTQTLAMAFAPRIRVNGIGPGPVLPSKRQTEEQFARQCQALPLENGATLEEICAAIDFILKTPSMTGQMIALDGGQHLPWDPKISPRFE